MQVVSTGILDRIETAASSLQSAYQAILTGEA